MTTVPEDAHVGSARGIARIEPRIYGKGRWTHPKYVDVLREAGIYVVIALDR